jgi:hypothetical protein
MPLAFPFLCLEFGYLHDPLIVNSYAFVVRHYATASEMVYWSALMLSHLVIQGDNSSLICNPLIGFGMNTFDFLIDSPMLSALASRS